MPSSVRPVDVVRVAGGASAPRRDVAAAEEPLEIRLNGSPFIVTMRTPGDDEDLAVGLLLSERLLGSDPGTGRIKGLSRVVPGSDPNQVDVFIDDERAAKALAERRLVTVTSACGVCGRQSIDDLMRGVPRLDAGMTMASAVVARLPERLRAAQAAFEETGGLHAAGLFDAEGTLIAVAEDVGRHNAVDKVIGSQLRAGRLPLGDRALMVSGRTSFEIVQKAVVAGIPILAAVSAPSSLAVDLAREANLTLLGFVRGDTFNIYAGADRIRL
ncbi:MAG: formate dehydrogenase accessory sulfurtransferase FdhD [Acidimicrobiia bacterium]|nr:formate dehydrogenase accessory sulfurtransferase FdhD [Acidimicrobiia bacterium]